MNKTYKVTQIENNNLDNNILQKSQGAMVISFAPSILAIPFLKHILNETNENVLKTLATKSNIKYENEIFYDVEGNEVNKNYILLGLANNLYHISEQSLKNDNDSSIFIGNTVKSIIEQILLKYNLEKSSTNMSVEDLMAKLYESDESRSKAK